MPPSYQQAFEESVDDNCKDNELGHVSSKRKQMLSAAKNNSTKQEVSHQVNPNTSPQQCVKYHQFQSPEKKRPSKHDFNMCVVWLHSQCGDCCLENFDENEVIQLKKVLASAYLRFIFLR